MVPGLGSWHGRRTAAEECRPGSQRRNQQVGASRLRLGTSADPVGSAYPFKTVAVAVNLTRLRICGWVSFLTCVVGSRSGSDGPSLEALTRCWMECDDVFNYANLVVFSRSSTPCILLASPFDRSPLGRPLPDLCLTCPCRLAKPARGRKRWIVEHTASDGCAVKDVRVTASCSNCRRTWCLPCSDMMGTVRRISDRYSVWLILDSRCVWV